MSALAAASARPTARSSRPTSVESNALDGGASNLGTAEWILTMHLQGYVADGDLFHGIYRVWR